LTKKYGTTTRLPYTMKYDEGDVVHVKVVFSERKGSKKRHALLISAEKYHNRRQEVIIAAILQTICGFTCRIWKRRIG
ncbi:unnamed protein product, partial [marine sediment metagenome]